MASVLEGFLVKLGFNVDQDGLKRFQGSLNVATHAVAKVTQAAVGVGVAMATAFVKANSEVNKLYKVSNDTGASIRGVEALSHAFERVGGSSEEALSAINTLATNIKTNTRFADMVTSRFGVQLKDRNGNLRDMSQIFIELRNKISRIAEVNPELAKTQAEALGLGNAFSTMMKDDFLAEWQRASREMAAFGDSMDRNATKAHDLQNALSRVWDTFAAGSKTLAMDFLEASGLEKWFDSLSTSLSKKVPALVSTIGEGFKSYFEGKWSISDVVKKVFEDRATDNALAEADEDEEEGNPELKALLERTRKKRESHEYVSDTIANAYNKNLERTSGIIDGTQKPTESSVYYDNAKRVDSLTGKKSVEESQAQATQARKPKKQEQKFQIVYDDDGNELRIPVKPVAQQPVESVPASQTKQKAEKPAELKAVVEVPEAPAQNVGQEAKRERRRTEPVAQRTERPKRQQKAPEQRIRVDIPKPERFEVPVVQTAQAEARDLKPQDDGLFRNAEKLSQEMRELQEQAKRFKESIFKNSSVVPNNPVSAMVRDVAGNVTNNRTESKVANVTVNQTINVQGSSDPMATAQAVQRETKESISRNTVSNLM